MSRKVSTQSRVAGVTVGIILFGGLVASLYMNLRILRGDFGQDMKYGAEVFWGYHRR